MFVPPSSGSSGSSSTRRSARSRVTASGFRQRVGLDESVPGPRRARGWGGGGRGAQARGAPTAVPRPTPLASSSSSDFPEWSSPMTLKMRLRRAGGGSSGRRGRVRPATSTVTMSDARGAAGDHHAVGELQQARLVSSTSRATKRTVRRSRSQIWDTPARSCGSGSRGRRTAVHEQDVRLHVVARARAISTCCFMPPESSRGKALREAGRRPSPRSAGETTCALRFFRFTS